MLVYVVVQNIGYSQYFKRVFAKREAAQAYREAMTDKHERCDLEIIEEEVM